MFTRETAQGVTDALRSRYERADVVVTHQDTSIREDSLFANVYDVANCDADFLFFDDVRRLQSASLAAFLTSEQFQCRFPDVTTIQRLPQRTLTIASGNQVTVDDDLLRRSIRIRLTGRSLPSGHRAAFPSLEAIRQHREEILQALLTLVRGWCEAGQPVPPNLPNMGSFNTWAQIVGGILSVAGVAHFLEGETDAY